MQARRSFDVNSADAAWCERISKTGLAIDLVEDNAEEPTELLRKYSLIRLSDFLLNIWN